MSGEVWDSPDFPFPIYNPKTMIQVEGHDVWRDDETVLESHQEADLTDPPHAAAADFGGRARYSRVKHQGDC